MAVAAFLLTLSCTMAPAVPGVVPHDECAVMELQRFDNASLQEIEDCASMADALLLMNRFGSRCEVVPMSAKGDTPDRTTLDKADAALFRNEPSAMGEDGAKPHRVRYGGNLIQQVYDQPSYTF